MNRQTANAISQILGYHSYDELIWNIVREDSSRTSCSNCNAKIPPGRAGRECKECRKRKQIAILITPRS